MRTYGNAVPAIDAEFGATGNQHREGLSVLEFNYLHGAFAHTYTITFAFLRADNKEVQLLVLSSDSHLWHAESLKERFNNREINFRSLPMFPDFALCLDL